MSVYVGAYTSDIIRFERDPATGKLSAPRPVAQLPHATWLAWHRDTLYAVSETPTGSVAAFKDGTVPLGQQPSHGGDPCHLAIDPAGGHLMVANYGGSVAVFPIEPDGSLAPASDIVILPPGAHAHQAVFLGDTVLVPDLGHDTVNVYTLDSGQLSHTATMNAPPNSGPRHLALGEVGYRFVLAELSSQLLVFDPSNKLESQCSATVAPYEGENFPSGLTFSPDRRFLYVANRGVNCISVFAIDGSQVTPIQDVPCGGDWPRDVTFIDEMLYVANQRSDDIAIFAVDKATGVPELTASVRTPAPARILAS